ncbi:superoxide dismutase [Escherichia coli PA22]|nr:superoxide dismutase [Escherichia coli PA22]
MKCKIIAAIAMLTAASCGYAAEQEVPMNLVSADGKEVSIGKITIQETPLRSAVHTSPSLSV